MTLTKKLKKIDSHLKIHIIQECWAQGSTLFEDERLALTLSETDKIWLREITMICNNEPWVFARTIIPTQHLNSPFNALINSGQEPIGNLLFSNENIQRQIFSFAAVNEKHAWHQHIKAQTTINEDEPAQLKNQYWIRQSQFNAQSDKLLLTECFLPAMTNALETT